MDGLTSKNEGPVDPVGERINFDVSNPSGKCPVKVCTNLTPCGDGGCSCVKKPNPDTSRIVFGWCGMPKKMVKRGEMVVIDECFCNATFTHTECCAGGRAVDGLLEL